MSLRYLGSPYLLRISPKDLGVIYGAIRRAYSQSAHARKIRSEARVKATGPRGGKRFKCAACGAVKGAGSINVDHINPVVPIVKHYSTLSWDQRIARLWCKEENLQVLCTDCHKKKSKEEAALRKKARANRTK